MALVQSFGEPENLNLNLYGRDGRCISSRLLLITVRSARASSKQDISQRAAPTQDMEVRSAGPAPPMSKPISLSSSKAGCTLAVVQPWNMMSPDWPWKAIKPEPCFSHRVLMSRSSFEL